ncbi:aminopyrimidine aminohydrolase [Synergistales bacterium]|nr:aminopyrimidine aminohydrolase [Synergistales bacterium]
MSFSKGLKEYAKEAWEAGYSHPFVQELGSGTLDREKFKFYLLQDYQYLLAYAKVFALGVVKADSREVMARFSASQDAILNSEMALHREYMMSFGVTVRDMDEAKPSLFNRTYTANMLAVGQAGGVAEILAAILPCAWTYSDYAKRLKNDFVDNLSENFYKSWIDGYASDEFYESFEWFFSALDELCRYKSEQELARIREIFASGMEFEYLFWDMSYKRQMSYDNI